jgi:hypothetical protein
MAEEMADRVDEKRSDADRADDGAGAKSGGAKQSGPERIRASRKWRWPIALGLAILAVLVSWVVLYAHGHGICRDATAGTRIVHLCAPPSVAELALLFIPALAFLFPDLSEINVAGFGIKREVEKVEEVSQEQVEGLTKAVDRLSERSREQLADLSKEAHDVAIAVREVDTARKRDKKRLTQAVEALEEIEVRLARLEQRPTR